MALRFSINGKPVYQPENVRVVAKSGGDYSTVQAAIDSITDATVNNPYLVWIAPGVYAEMVTMQAHVYVQGAGQGATVISSSAATGAWPPNTGTVILAADTTLRDVTVLNTGGGSRNVAVFGRQWNRRTPAWLM